jgi:hypothetical protein
MLYASPPATPAFMPLGMYAEEEESVASVLYEEDAAPVGGWSVELGTTAVSSKSDEDGAEAWTGVGST